MNTFGFELELGVILISLDVAVAMVAETLFLYQEPRG
jgi:hypothetical protein